MVRLGRRSLALLVLLAAAACAPKPPPAPPAIAFQPARFADLPGYSADRVTEALPALNRSCARMMPRNDRGLDSHDRYGTGNDWKPFCTALAALPPGDDSALRRLVESELQPVAVIGDGKAEGLFTGYYEPLVRGSRQKQGRYTVPLYRQPPDLVQVDLGEFRDSLKGQRIAGRVRDGRLRPYEDRGAIEAGALANRNLELVWLDDASDAFFLQVQGSGLVQLDSGAKTRVGFAAQNGHPYVAIGRVMIDRGTLSREDVSMQAIRAWLRANPDAAPDLLRQNPSYVFFRELPAPKDDLDGPPGAQGVALVPGRSLAVDRSHFALGLPVWLDAQQPALPTGDKPLQRLMVAQDTGGAIRGAVRGDVFWGAGVQAESVAGRMKHPGRFWLLLPKTVAAKLAAVS
ncbi:MAG: murein transglycosylase A [Ferrovibrio sp.]|uniref:murein transglycosylase A n=1 Tax=Ferrovibrio sp. TaxID=1917215 RepID=UPI002609B653|nr:MltA domain-containing protein [Ferrovibrio sp.]MCW0233082.1 murein transglycosylase A [Ferrovibrio sp.]